MFCSMRGKWGSLVEMSRESRDHGIKMPYIYIYGQMFLQSRGTKRRKRVDYMKENPKTANFWHILEKPTHPFLTAWSLLLVHVPCTPSRQGPKRYLKKIHFLKIGPWKNGLRHGTPSWFHGVHSQPGPLHKGWRHRCSSLACDAVPDALATCMHDLR